MKTQTKYKLHNGLPSMTEVEWIDYAHNLYVALKFGNGGKCKDSTDFYNLIIKKFKLKTI